MGRAPSAKQLPFSTLFIHLSGAFILGLLFALKLPVFVYALVGTGVLGGYTTFSTLNSELLALWHDRKYWAFTLLRCLLLSRRFIVSLAGQPTGENEMNQKQLRGLTVALMLGNVMSGLDSTIINTAIPAIIADLHGIQFMGWIVAIFLLGAGGMGSLPYIIAGMVYKNLAQRTRLLTLLTAS